MNLFNYVANRKLISDIVSGEKPLPVLSEKYNINSSQMEQIELGIEYGLKPSQIMIYIDQPAEKMEELRLCLLDRIPDAQVKKYIDLGFDSAQINRVRYGVEHNFTSEQIEMYAKPNIDVLKMDELIFGIEHGLSSDQLEICINNPLSPAAMRQIVLGAEHGLSNEQLMSCIKNTHSKDELTQMRINLENELSHKEMAPKVETDFTSKSESEQRLSYEQVEPYLHPSAEANEAARSSFENGVAFIQDDEELEYYKTHSEEYGEIEEPEEDDLEL